MQMARGSWWTSDRPGPNLMQGCDNVCTLFSKIVNWVFVKGTRSRWCNINFLVSSLLDYPLFSWVILSIQSVCNVIREGLLISAVLKTYNFIMHLYGCIVVLYGATSMGCNVCIQTELSHLLGKVSTIWNTYIELRNIYLHLSTVWTNYLFVWS